MSDEKFTRGEWLIALMDNRSRIVIESENTGYWIADIQNITSFDIANANLISAAPAMYRALKEIVEGHKKEVGGGFLCSHELIDAESALGKARGEL